MRLQDAQGINENSKSQGISQQRGLRAHTVYLLLMNVTLSHLIPITWWNLLWLLWIYKDLMILLHILLYRGVCTQAPCYCILMEFCAQGQLYEVLRAGRKVTPSLLVDWSMGIAGGMNYLHLHKIIHRDLKSPK